jgi:glycosyltransferase involved in cell wall biosynthesis
MATVTAAAKGNRMADQQVNLPRTALLVQGTEEYGVGQVALILARELKRRNLAASIVALERGSLTERCEAEGIDCRVLDLPPWPRFQRSKWKTLWALMRQQAWLRQAAIPFARALQELGVGQLVVQWPTQVSMAGKSARIASVPCYWMMPNIVANSWPLGVNRKYYRLLCKKYGIKPLPNSRFTGETLSGGGANDLGTEVLYLGVDETQFEPGRKDSFTRAELGLPAGAAVAGIFARLEPTKGHEVFWRAMIEFIREGQELHLLAIGGPTDGPVAERLRALAEEHSCASRLHFAGWTREPQRYYGAIDFAVNSRIDPEPFGLSVIEAMLMSRPVLVHALGGPAETVVDGVTGWHVREPSVAAFGAGLRRALADRARWIEMGEAGRQHALANFSAATFAENFLRIAGRSTAAPLR